MIECGCVLDQGNRTGLVVRTHDDWMWVPWTGYQSHVPCAHGECVLMSVCLLDGFTVKDGACDSKLEMLHLDLCEAM